MKLTVAGLCAVGCFAIVGAYSLNAQSNDERHFSIYNIHNKESLDIVYMRNGKRIPEAIKKINWVMRDWRENEPTTMAPRLIDTLWQIHKELGSNEPIHLISGYRSPKTNAMLRRTRGGQAKKSQHMRGNAADVHFPDVPVKHLRYAALVRQQGGVGYYPTSALPFVHVDVGPVRHWPRMGRTELALLFPSGSSKHRPSSGGAITKRDVIAARKRNKSLSQQVAAFFDTRGQPAPPRPTRVASATRNAFRAKLPTRIGTSKPANPAQTPKPRAGITVAALGPTPLPAQSSILRPPGNTTAISEPKLKAAPRVAERPSTFETKQPSALDRRKLTELFSLASLMPAANYLYEAIAGTGNTDANDAAGTTTPKANANDTRTLKRDAELTIAALIESHQLTIEPQALHAPAPKSETRLRHESPESTADSSDWQPSFVSAPAYDDEHPDELQYRPFQLAPLLTATSSPHDPALAHMTHPDVAETLNFVDETLTALPMKLRPPTQVAANMWSDHFTSRATASTQANGPTAATASTASFASGFANRAVRTTAQ